MNGRCVLTIKTDKKGNFLKAKARCVLSGFQEKPKEYQQTDPPASQISDELPNGSQQKLEHPSHSS